MEQQQFENNYETDKAGASSLPKSPTPVAALAVRSRAQERFCFMLTKRVEIKIGKDEQLEMFC